MCHSDSARFPCAVTTPQQARDFCRAVLRDLFPAGPTATDAIEDYLLVASELASNAVQAGCTGVTVTAEIHRDHVRLAAEDDAPGLPQPVRPGPDEPHGRGLAIVAALSRDWGVQHQDGGKQIWADLPIPPGLAVAVNCGL